MPNDPPKSSSRAQSLVDRLKRHSAGKDKKAAGQLARTHRDQPAGTAQQSASGAGSVATPKTSRSATRVIDFDSDSEGDSFQTPGRTGDTGTDPSDEDPEPVDETIRPIGAPAQEAAGGGDDDDGNDGEGDGGEDDPDPTNQANNHLTMANNPVKGTEALTIPTFDGTEGLGVQSWTRAVDRAIVQFQWGQEPTAAAAKQRLTDKAAFWLTQQDEAGVDLKTWKNLKKAMTDRFYPVVTDLMATDAMKELKQRPNESGGDFLDRVWSAVHLMNTKVEQADLDACCLETFTECNHRSVRHMFGSGIHQATRDKIYQSHKPPTTLDDLLTAVRSVEAETKRQAQVISNQATEPSRTKDTVRLVTSAAVDGHSGQEEKTSPEATEIDAIVEAIKKFKTKGNCFTCGKEGHWANKCPSKGSGGRGGRNRNRGYGNRGRGNSYQSSNWRQPTPFGFGFGGGGQFRPRRPANAMEAAAVAFQQFQQGQWQAPATDILPIDFSADQQGAAAAAQNAFLTEFPSSEN